MVRHVIDQALQPLHTLKHGQSWRKATDSVTFCVISSRAAYDDYTAEGKQEVFPTYGQIDGRTDERFSTKSSDQSK